MVLNDVKSKLCLSLQALKLTFKNQCSFLENGYSLNCHRQEEERAEAVYSLKETLPNKTGMVNIPLLLQPGGSTALTGTKTASKVFVPSAFVVAVLFFLVFLKYGTEYELC